MARPSQPVRRSLALVAASLLVLAAACSSSDSSSDGAASKGDSASSTTSGSGSTKPVSAGHACDQGAVSKDVKVVPVDGVATDRTMTSFEGTEIRLHWFPVDGASKAKPAPTVLMGPGWSLAGDTAVDGGALFGALSIKGLHQAGYNVLTWDPRGFGESTGNAEVDNPEFEGHDGQLMLDWVAQQPEALTDAPGDPRVGMVGFSYGGGIQLTLAAIDCRVDVIVPGIAWHSIETSLFKNRTVKSGWASILSNTGGGHVDPHITSASKTGISTGLLSQEDEDWFRARGPGDLVDEITVPTLVVQGTVDGLFTLAEGIANYDSFRSRDIPSAMIWFCGGHGTCLTDPGDPERVSEVEQAWLKRYLTGDTSVDTGPRFEFVDQEGTSWTADDLPEPDGSVEVSGSGTLALKEEGGAGPSTVKPKDADVLSGLVAGITPGPATNSVDVAVDPGQFSGTEFALGAPSLSITYSGTSPAGDKPTRLFAQLVDESGTLVIGNQVTPIQVTLDGQTRTVKVDLEPIAQKLTPGKKLTLQVVAVTPAYATPRLGGQVTLSQIHLTVPTVSKGLTKR